MEHSFVRIPSEKNDFPASILSFQAFPIKLWERLECLFPCRYKSLWSWWWSWCIRHHLPFIPLQHNTLPPWNVILLSQVVASPVWTPLWCSSIIVLVIMQNSHFCSSPPKHYPIIVKCFDILSKIVIHLWKLNSYLTQFVISIFSFPAHEIFKIWHVLL